MTALASALEGAAGPVADAGESTGGAIYAASQLLYQSLH